MSIYLSASRGWQLKRWLPFLTVVVLLHLTLIQWAMSPFATLADLEPPQQVMSADLQQLPAPESLKPVPVRKTPKPKVEPVVVEDDPVAPIAPTVASVKAESAPAEPDKTTAASSEDSVKQPISLGVLTHYSVNPPPSAELKYNAHSQHKGQNIYGSSRIKWQTNGSSFSIKGEFSILFLSLLNFSSEGVIDPKTGVSPTIYAEKRMRRPETNTHFHRERNTISFSASSLAYERPGGEQDRASIVWQLVGIGRQSGDKFVPGNVLNIAVAGIRDADVWNIRIVGIEEVETGLGIVSAWHLVRSARKNSYEQSLDVWLAPKHEWYPVKVRYTNTNGDFLDLSLSDITRP